jgi:hypothetical protein
MAAVHPSPPFDELTYYPTTRWIRGMREAGTLINSRRAMLVWEPEKTVPIYAFPAEDVALAFAGDVASLGLRWFDDPDLAGFVTVRWDALEHWYEDDEEVFGHPRDPFVRIDALRGSPDPRVPARASYVERPHPRPYVLVAAALRGVLRFPLSAAQRIREQVEHEDRARLIARFAALEAGQSDVSHHLMWQVPVQHSDEEDPLERLWQLPARQPRTPS